MRLIDADALFRQVSKNLGTSTMYLPIDFQEEIMEAPTVDAIQIELTAQRLGRAFHSEPEKWADWLRMIRDGIDEQEGENG